MLVTYDIELDKVRHKVAEACKDYGLTRIQCSVFMGRLHANLREELEGRLRLTLGDTPGDIRIFPLCDKDVRLASEIVVKGLPSISRRKHHESDEDENADTADGRALFIEDGDRRKRRVGRWEVPERDDDHLYPFDSD